MKRREFFMDCGFFALGGTLGACCKINSKNNAILDEDDTIKYKHPGWINHVEFLITHHCNLNCASCN